MALTRSMIPTFEELSSNAWPALQTIVYDGWLLRFAAGYTKRANSIHPLYESSEDIEKKIAVCEVLYAGKQNQDVIFKLTEASQPASLDAVLETRGYRIVDRTRVQTLDLSLLPPKAPMSSEHGLIDVQISPTLTSDWRDAYLRLSAVAEHHRTTMEKMLGCIVAGRPTYVSLIHRDTKDVIAVGLAVQERGYIGLFDIVVAEEQRGQGLGSLLMNSLLAVSKENGAHTAYLQVVKSNIPACRLYAKLGFTEIYDYWYRVRSAQDFP
jgi:ribosomal protein S18 acetylase RimI-like enzyme